MPSHRRPLLRAALAFAVLLGATAVPVAAASARPPRCDHDESACPDRPEPELPDEPPGPEPQPQPPAPYLSPSAYTYSQFALATDVHILAALTAPAPPGDKPWPSGLTPVPFTPEISGAAVRVNHVRGTDDVWVFASYDAGGLATLCVSTCSDQPWFGLNPNYGLYQASLHVRPRLDVEFWRVQPSTVPQEGFISTRLAEVTVTVHMRAFAECAGWESGDAALNAKFGIDNLTIRRDTDVWEDIANLFVPSLTSSINAGIRNELIQRVGVGRFFDAPPSGSACHSLGVSGDAATGAINWNTEPCMTPLICGGGPGPVNAPA